MLQVPKATDPRIGLLQAFFISHKCPDESIAFISAADAYNLDYRTLVPIWIIESGCGRQELHHNGFGFGNGTIPYLSTDDAIWSITEALANGRYYAGKTLEQKIKTYNSVNKSYWTEYEQLSTTIH